MNRMIRTGDEEFNPSITPGSLQFDIFHFLCLFFAEGLISRNRSIRRPKRDGDRLILLLHLPTRTTKTTKSTTTTTTTTTGNLAVAPEEVENDAHGGDQDEHGEEDGDDQSVRGLARV